jgi:hypothetical protein
MQNSQENVSITENFRLSIYNTKKQELDKELQKYEKYCYKSRDLEHILRLHNFLLRSSYKEIKSIYDTFLDRTESETDVEEVAILQKTFDLLFIDNAFDFLNEFAIRIYVNVREEYQFTDGNRILTGVEVIYKGDDTRPIILTNNDLQELFKDTIGQNLSVNELKKSIINHNSFEALLGNVIQNILLNATSLHNTILFNGEVEDNKKTYYNASDFKKLLKTGQFAKYLLKLDDVEIITNIIEN